MPLEWSNERDWDNVWNQYFQVASRSQDSALNTFCYYVAKRAIAETFAPTGADIRAGLTKTSDKYPTADIADILTRKASKGQHLNAQQTKEAKEKFIRRRIASRAFAKAGWIPAVKILEAKVDKDFKGYSGDNVGRVKMKGQPKGGAIPANGGFNQTSECTIYNSVREKDRPPALVKRMQDGLNAAIAKEFQGKVEYIEKKLQRAVDETINRNR